jgi:hypothetical protein
MTKDTCHISAYLELYVKSESTKDRHLIKSAAMTDLVIWISTS